MRRAATLTVTWLGLALSVLACSAASAPAPRLPPPLDTSPGSTWAYGAYLLSTGDADAALGYLEPLAAGPLDNVVNPALLLRDLAEARLLSGNAQGAVDAARAARDQLARRPRIAQFQADDRRLFERSIDALEAAGNDDVQQLSAMTDDESITPSADVWYLLGWLDERRGDPSAAQAAYRAYLARSPRWAFLREAGIMRRHALQALSS